MSRPRAKAGADPDATRARSWQERIGDPDEPVFTVGVAADLLGVDAQTLRRLGESWLISRS